jgi:hypothetical protein
MPASTSPENTMQNIVSTTVMAVAAQKNNSGWRSIKVSIFMLSMMVEAVDASTAKHRYQA